MLHGVESRWRLPMRVCQECRKSFLPKKNWQRFDSKECQQAWNRRRYREERVRNELGLPPIVEEQRIVDLGELEGMI
jgi:hypothetical protein